MAKLVGSAHIMDLRLDLMMIRMNGSSQTVTLEPKDLGLDDFSEVAPGRALDAYDDDGKTRYAFSGEALSAAEPLPAEPLEPPTSIDVDDDAGKPFNPVIPLPHEGQDGD